MASIKLLHNYPVSKEKIWSYLTSDERLTSWCLPSKNFLLERGRQFRFESTPSVFWDGVFINTILDFEVNSFLSYRCINEGLNLNTVVTWRIRSSNDSVQLSLEHSGFRPFKDLLIKIALTGGWKNMMRKSLYDQLTAAN
ncbi:MAG: SRPBCC domain-containing protein [Treponema sp.]|nr:SRPBCC domain-containing protein [Treponema sp.]